MQLEQISMLLAISTHSVRVNSGHRDQLPPHRAQQLNTSNRKHNHKSNLNSRQSVQRA
eukprot:COSAG03_NODE_17466_length_375_cov_0.601449_2_plen_57_part_01